MPPRAVRNVKRNNVIRASFEHVIRGVPLQIALVGLLVTVSPIELRSVANLPSLIEVQITGTGIVETFQYDESSEPFDASDRTFENLIEVSESRSTEVD